MRCLPIAVAGAMLAPALASAQLKPDPRWEISPRGGVLMGHGKLAVDLVVNGVRALSQPDAEGSVIVADDLLSFDFGHTQSELSSAENRSLVSKDLGVGDRF
ncbi:MAG: hypothetical protein KA738_05610 [Pseudoxanthomonas sp.]|nr:hypothetical protein [Pseudoxanthomonas sp.]